MCHHIHSGRIHRAQNVLAVHLSLHNPGSLKISELRSENFLRDLRDAPLQFTVAFMTRLELSENQRLPYNIQVALLWMHQEQKSA
jgi:hypothetical protein